MTRFASLDTLRAACLDLPAGSDGDARPRHSPARTR